MIKTSLTELLYILCGLVCFYSTYETLKDKNHASRIPTALFWGILGFTFTFSRIGLLWGNEDFFIKDIYIGYLVLVLTILSAFKLVKFGKIEESSKEFKEKASGRIGNNIFVPALALALVTFFVAQVWSKQIGSLVALGVGSVVASIMALSLTKGTPKEMSNDGRRLLEIVGPVSILPQLLAALGSVFAAAEVGTVISNGISGFIPQGNILAGVIAYCLGMALFTMIMGNAFAAFAVITAGIGVPFLLTQGGDPVIVAALGLTAGFCGTLLTPMAANFNIVPTAILEIKDKKNGVIKYQAPIAIVMLVIHIVLMYNWAFS
jgi:uncharacterized membrane protein